MTMFIFDFKTFCSYLIQVMKVKVVKHVQEVIIETLITELEACDLANLVIAMEMSRDVSWTTEN